MQQRRLATTQAAIRRTITDHHLHQPPRRQQLTRQRQRRAAQQRVATRAAELGFGSVRAYLADRLVTQAWTLAEVAAELDATPAPSSVFWTTTAFGSGADATAARCGRAWVR